MAPRNYKVLLQSEVKTLEDLLKERGITKKYIAENVGFSYQLVSRQLHGCCGINANIAKYVYSRLNREEVQFLMNYFPNNERQRRAPPR